MTRKRSTRRDETHAEPIKRNNAVYEQPAEQEANGATAKPNGARKGMEFFTGTANQAGATARTYTAIEMARAVKVAYYLGKAEQQERLDRAGRKVEKMKAALLLANEAIADICWALVD
jgi:hypothetical protein